MYELVYNTEKIGNYTSFEKAFIELYKLLNTDLEKGMSWYLLEQTIWIKNECHLLPMMFYEARDHAHEIGLLTETGQLNEEMVKTIE